MMDSPWPTFNKLLAKLNRLGNIGYAEMEPLLIEAEMILVEDNRKGVLSGMDVHGVSAPPLKYRGQRIHFPKVRARPAAKFGRVFAQFQGTAGDNLTTAQYQQLNGPRLAPRGEQSRVITNFRTQHGQQGGVYFVGGAWVNVVNKQGRPFLRYHFTGRGHNPKYDLRGIRRWGMEKTWEAVRRWAKDILTRTN